jgi:hypothetical protein
MSGQGQQAGKPGVDAIDEPPPLGPRLTVWRLLGAFALNCVLFFAMTFVFLWLGPYALTPAIVIATILTGRIARIRRLTVLLLLGVLTFIATILLVQLLAMAYVLNNPVPGA